jgi:hypothetical protein
MKHLNIADGVRLDLNLMTLATAVLANRGAGKTYTASVIAEELLSLKQQVVIIDPVGVMYGLKSGFSLPIFGGEHQDLPLSPASGEELAKAVVEHRFSLILDTSDMTNSDGLRFVGSFLHELYRLKARHRESCYVIVDEADMFAPQGATSGNGPACLGAMQFLVRRGRARGLGCALVTQRPQAIAKDVLTQCEVLIAMRMSHNLDIGAVKLWMQSQASTEQAKEMVDSLPSLPTGEAWFWAPSLKVFQRAKVRKRVTFDSSATPEPGKEAEKPRELQEVDLAKLGKQIAATVEQKRANDPAVLKRRIAELERGSMNNDGLASSALADARAKVASYAEENRVLQEALSKDSELYAGLLNTVEAKMLEFAGILKDLRERYAAVNRAIKSLPPAPAPQVKNVRAVPAPTPARVLATPADDGEEMPPGERIVLTAFAQYGTGLNRETVTALTGYKRSTRNAYIQRLQGKGYLSLGAEPLKATQEGMVALGNFEPLPEGRALLAWWMARVPEGERKVLECIAQEPFVTREEITAITDYKRSTRNAYIQRLQGKMIVVVDGDAVRLAEALR